MPIDSNETTQQKLNKETSVISQLINHFFENPKASKLLVNPTKVSTIPGFGTTLMWEENFLLHREDAPALMTFDNSNQLRISEWYSNGKLNSQRDQPSRTRYFEHGGIHTQEWHLNNDPHRRNGPAYLEYDLGGELTGVRYATFSDLHNEDGPALLCKNADGTTTAAWFKNGVLHNERGPAIVVYSNVGRVLQTSYYIEGEPPKPQSHPRALFEKPNFHLLEDAATDMCGGDHE